MVSEAVKLERERRKTMREAALYKVVMDPVVLATATYLIGLYSIEHIPWSSDQERNQRMKMLAQTVNAYSALARAGAKGWPAALAAGAGGLLASGQSSQGNDWWRAAGATGIGAGFGTLLAPGVGTAIGAGVGFGIDEILQAIGS